MNPFEQQVRERAYDIWEGEGRVFGRADDHWLRAERELQGAPEKALLRVQQPAAEASLSLSPAKALKAKPARAKSDAAKAVADKAAVAEVKTAKARGAKAAPKVGAAKPKAPGALANASATLH